MVPDNESGRQHIYLTFDDGPLKGSENVDSVILEEQLQVSMFIVGKHAQQSEQLTNYLKRYQENPFVEVCNHSYSHASGRYKEFYSRPSKVLADVQKNESLLKLQFKIVRLPGRNMWRIGNRRKNDIVSGSVAADLLAKNGYKVYGWDLEWQHNPGDSTPIQSVAEMEKKIMRLLDSRGTFTRNHLVLLMHDQMFQTKTAQN
ncbi:MAG: hypothetical protein JWQ09_5688, partial [Segetibacter sp.]|nr:hypothetical protein [Segetibacter sp.]